ncbi:hypothetical protein AOZ06_52600 [Kibdelosporangium phytohabitans]|uniref:Uncharacterized protein n=2 Tax=Kibdelosporangium phytohabitans TaxID=860235 RepID=A0A0N9IFW9_9PSEU|nr:hypothetical protein AOZ06_52600 [Kibdelosporangium phytohabitans]
MAAVAAAAVLIAVPIMVVQQVNGPLEPGALPVVSGVNPPLSTASISSLPGQDVEYRPREGETLLTPPAVLSAEQQPGSDKPLMSYAYVVEAQHRDRRLCFTQAPERAPINGPEQAKYGEPNCVKLNEPKQGKFEWGRMQGITNTTRAMWVYVMSRPAAEMLLKQPEGTGYTQATSPKIGADLAVFVAYVNAPKPPKQFTVFDAQHQTLQNGE